MLYIRNKVWRNNLSESIYQWKDVTGCIVGNAGSGIHIKGHYIRYTLLVAGCITFTFITALIVHYTDSKRCWRDSSENLIFTWHYLTISHICCRFMTWISFSTTSQRCSIILRSGDYGDISAQWGHCHVQETNLSFLTWCITLLEAAIQRWFCSGHTQVGYDFLLKVARPFSLTSGVS